MWTQRCDPAPPKHPSLHMSPVTRGTQQAGLIVTSPSPDRSPLLTRPVVSLVFVAAAPQGPLGLKFPLLWQQASGAMNRGPRWEGLGPTP